MCVSSLTFMSKRVRTAGGSGTDRASDELGVTVRYPARDDGSLAEVDGYGFTKLVKHHTVCMGARVCVRVHLGKSSCVWTRACGHVYAHVCTYMCPLFLSLVLGDRSTNTNWLTHRSQSEPCRRRTQSMSLELPLHQRRSRSRSRPAQCYCHHSARVDC